MTAKAYTHALCIALERSFDDIRLIRPIGIQFLDSNPRVRCHVPVVATLQGSEVWGSKSGGDQQLQ